MAVQTAKSGKPLTKSQVIAELAEKTDLGKKDIVGVIDALSGLIESNLSSGGPGVFNIPGLLKIKVVRKPAVPEREGINPFTGEQTTFKAKPARNVVKIQPLKNLKEMV